MNIDDGLVDRMRKVYARDLIIEKVDETSPADRRRARQREGGVRGESVARGDSRVVADVTLTHK